MAILEEGRRRIGRKGEGGPREEKGLRNKDEAMRERRRKEEGRKRRMQE